MPATKTKVKSGTSVTFCTCVSSYQDAKYGAGRRVHNFSPNHPSKASGGWRCTVCNREKTA